MSDAWVEFNALLTVVDAAADERISVLFEAIDDMITYTLASLNQHENKVVKVVKVARDRVSKAKVTKVARGKVSKAKAAKVAKGKGKTKVNKVGKTKGHHCPYSVGDRVACFWRDNSKNPIEKLFEGTVVAVGERKGDWSITVRHPAQHGHDESLDEYPRAVFERFRGRLLH